MCFGRKALKGLGFGNGGGTPLSPHGEQGPHYPSTRGAGGSEPDLPTGMGGSMGGGSATAPPRLPLTQPPIERSEPRGSARPLPPVNGEKDYVGLSRIVEIEAHFVRL